MDVSGRTERTERSLCIQNSRKVGWMPKKKLQPSVVLDGNQGSGRVGTQGRIDSGNDPREDGMMEVGCSGGREGLSNQEIQEGDGEGGRDVRTWPLH